MLREIDNYFFFLRQLELLADTGELKHYMLKKNDKEHCIYGAINLPPELLMYNKGTDLEMMEKTYFGNEMAKMNQSMVEHEIIELYRIEYDRVKTDDYYAYVFSISYMWKLCNWRSISFTLAWILSAIAAVVYGIISII